MTIKVFDFFSGCGGTSCGFNKAGLDVAFGLDIDPDAAATFRLNFPGAAFHEGDICSLPTDALATLIGPRRDPLLFSGCAPCQPFSKQNRQRKKSDPRRKLLSEFARFVQAWLPEYVFIENVPGMQKIRTADGPLGGFTKLLSSLGYSVDIGIVPALWFGVPQTRERLVLLASRIGTVGLPKPTHGTSKKPFATVQDWIADLPPLQAGEESRDDPDHRAAHLSDLNLQRIKATPEGGGRQHWPKELWLACHSDYSGHTDVYGRLSWAKPAAGLTTRCISYSNGRFGHPEQHRAISVREAACLQTFPRKYRFIGSLESKARQIGNAVPPEMARAIGAHIRQFHARECRSD
ncbi:DNA (cytosine-5)-methyltransferase 1 [Paraburkholderia phenazinium]|jgi:DNA (cytosine-5)-methyltransferase 1|uniref:DNA (cytosine-5-)-methyltransferase n=1 Tax=Paraburkholderia phenazinium TaxID=60549 RepID=A0A1G8NK58_9BURK|nr:DNA cytosine methyltransferase [Paraburkholderia phenazinium]SDI80497.1 DNA (cytosine-5)-methyltransferase 1 [Paraburkholderia phenazinium]